MRKELRETAEIALCKALPEYVQVMPGRLQNLYEKVSKECDSVLENLPGLSAANEQRLINLIDRFESEAGWYKNGKHVCTVVSFLLSLLDGKEKCSKVIYYLKEVYDYFERDNKVPVPCDWAGALAAEKWERLIRGENR